MNLVKRIANLAKDRERFSQPISYFNKQKQPPEVFCKKVVLKNSAKLIRKTIALESLFNKVGDIKRYSVTGVFL